MPFVEHVFDVGVLQIVGKDVVIAGDVLSRFIESGANGVDGRAGGSGQPGEQAGGLVLFCGFV